MSDKKKSSLIQNIPHLVAFHNIRHAVISPGSRSALLSVYFERHPNIETTIVVDERCAAYIAMGMAQQLQQPVVLICTSGTAAINYAPALAEAYFQKIPLLVLTADRPAEWIGQSDGQTIYQDNLYGANIKGAFRLPCLPQNDDEIWHFKRQTCEAINLCNTVPKGPVQINIPIAEPFYSELLQETEQTDACVEMIQSTEAKRTLSDETWCKLTKTLNHCSNILILSGQNRTNKSILASLTKLAGKKNYVVLSDILANLNTCQYTLTHIDEVLKHVDDHALAKYKPDLMITFGESVLSKHLKQFIRKLNLANHWHVQEAGNVADVFQSVTQCIFTSPVDFFEKLTDSTLALSESSLEFQKHWQGLENHSLNALRKFKDNHASFNEFLCVDYVLNTLPDNSVLHLSNSMSVRYANNIGVHKNIEVYSNRGTAGIDGCLSTAVGHSIIDNRFHTLIIGDLAFFYDRNGLWLDRISNRLRIVLLNNQGGGIFNLIDGPRQLPECEKLFLTPHPLSAENTCNDFHIEYQKADNYDSLKTALGNFYMPSNTLRLIEIKTSIEENTLAFDHYRSCFR